MKPNRGSSQNPNVLHISNYKLNDPKNDQIFNLLKDKILNFSVFKDSEEYQDIIKQIKLITNNKDKDFLMSLVISLHSRKIDTPIILDNNDLHLNKGEFVLYHSNSISLWRHKTVSKTISSSGLKNNASGFRSFVGTVSSFDNVKLTLIETIGRIFITNKRVIFINPENKTYTIPMSRILSFESTMDSITLIVSNGDPYKFAVNNNHWYYPDGGIFIDSNYHIVKSLENILKC